MAKSKNKMNSKQHHPNTSACVEGDATVTHSDGSVSGITEQEFALIIEERLKNHQNSLGGPAAIAQVLQAGGSRSSSKQQIEVIIATSSNPDLQSSLDIDAQTKTAAVVQQLAAVTGGIPGALSGLENVGSEPNLGLIAEETMTSAETVVTTTISEHNTVQIDPKIVKFNTKNTQIPVKEKGWASLFGQNRAEGKGYKLKPTTVGVFSDAIYL